MVQHSFHISQARSDADKSSEKCESLERYMTKWNFQQFSIRWNALVQVMQKFTMECSFTFSKLKTRLFQRHFRILISSPNCHHVTHENLFLPIPILTHHKSFRLGFCPILSFGPPIENSPNTHLKNLRHSNLLLHGTVVFN